jgi:DNA invertase Pin-like site-specific DNA recombinase
MEAQREALGRFATAEGFALGRVFLEVETGKGADALDRRPQLAAALAEARRQRCAVAVAKLDRLSRDVHFIFGLIAAAKARGVTLGGPKLDEARQSAFASIKANADRHAANVMPIIREIQRAGAKSLRDIAEALNARGVQTARGGQWHATSVKNVLERGDNRDQIALHCVAISKLDRHAQCLLPNTIPTSALAVEGP